MWTLSNTAFTLTQLNELYLNKAEFKDLKIIYEAHEEKLSKIITLDDDSVSEDDATDSTRDERISPWPGNMGGSSASPWSGNMRGSSASPKSENMGGSPDYPGAPIMGASLSLEMNEMKQMMEQLQRH